MISFYKNKSIILTVLALTLTLMVGCSKPTIPTKPDTNNTDNTKNQNEVPDSSTKPTEDNSSTGSGSSSSTPVPTVNESQKTTMTSILKLAKQGKVINCEFPVNTTIIDTIEKKWGKADKSDYVGAAKGTYATFSKKGIVFGFNKGSQIFEVRTLNKDLGKLSISMIKDFLVLQLMMLKPIVKK